MAKKLVRLDGPIGGVCAGLADYFDMDVALVRIIALLLLLTTGVGLLTYIVCWIAIPHRSDV